ISSVPLEARADGGQRTAVGRGRTSLAVRRALSAVRLLVAGDAMGQIVAVQGDTIVSDRPFRVLGVQQIAVGGLDKLALRRFWVDTLGLTPIGTFRSEAENVDEDIVVAGSGPLRVEVDLMQPLDAEKKPKVHEPNLNHIGLWIDDLQAAFA